jgi:hypothetical protein
MRPEEGTRVAAQKQLSRIFVHFLYQDQAFDAFDDISDFLESITCEL